MFRRKTGRWWRRGRTFPTGFRNLVEVGRPRPCSPRVAAVVGLQLTMPDDVLAVDGNVVSRSDVARKLR